jgi:hypothetical protein
VHLLRCVAVDHDPFFLGSDAVARDQESGTAFVPLHVQGSFVISGIGYLPHPDGAKQSSGERSCVAR